MQAAVTAVFLGPQQWVDEFETQFGGLEARLELNPTKGSRGNDLAGSSFRDTVSQPVSPAAGSQSARLGVANGFGFGFAQ